MRIIAILIAAYLCSFAPGSIAAPAEKSQQVWTKDRQLYLNELSELVRLRRAKKALADIEAKIRLNPNDGLLYATRARVYTVMDENELAIADADKALSLLPNCALALTTKSEALSRMDRPKEAIVYSDKAFALQPDSRYVLDDRIKILSCIGRRKDAIAIAEKQLALDPDNGVKRGQLIKLYLSDKNPKKVIEYSSEELKRFPKAKNYEYFVTLRGNAYLQIGQWKQAEQDFSAAIKLNSMSLDGHRGLIKVYKMTGRVKEGEKLERDLKSIEGDFRPL